MFFLFFSSSRKKYYAAVVENENKAWEALAKKIGWPVKDVKATYKIVVSLQMPVRENTVVSV